MQSVQINLTKDEFLSKLQLLSNLSESTGNEDEDVSSNLIEVTYSNLRTLRNTNALVPGAWYRITDYVTTISNDYRTKHYENKVSTITNLGIKLLTSYRVAVAGDTGTNLSYRPFDVVVLALSNNTLSEEARVVSHQGNLDFKYSNLESWKIKYCLDNDPYRFYWADAASGKGVIYEMIDDLDNEAPYDFKNIVYLIPLKVASESASGNPLYYNYVFDISGEIEDSDMYYVYTFSNCLTDTAKTNLLTSLDLTDIDNILDASTVLQGISVDSLDSSTTIAKILTSHHNTIKRSVVDFIAAGTDSSGNSISVMGPIQYLNNNIVLNHLSLTAQMYSGDVTSSHCINMDYDTSFNIVLGNNITIENNSKGNKVLSIFGPVTIGSQCYNNVVYGASCTTIKDNSENNTIKYTNLSDISSNSPSKRGYIEIGFNCSNNLIVDSDYITLGNSCSQNIINIDETDMINVTTSNIEFGNYCESNKVYGDNLIFGMSCKNNTINGKSLIIQPFVSNRTNSLILDQISNSIITNNYSNYEED